MKKIITCFLLMALFVITTGCGTTDTDTNKKAPASGINAEVVKEEGAGEIKYLFEDFFKTSVPKGVSAKDKSINGDCALFAFFDDTKTFLDISFYYDKEATDADMAQKAKELAQNGNSSKADTIFIDDIPFYGINTPDYGLVRYIGAVNGIEVALAVYVEPNDSVVTAFIENTQFVKE